MLILFFLFVIGWGPVYIMVVVYEQFGLVFEALKLVAEFGMFSDIINLFLYNREVRVYLKQYFLHRVNI
jgi:hypothetical protein